MYYNIFVILQRLLGTDGILLYPVHSSRAHVHGEVYTRTSGVAYTMLGNVAGLPATAVPIFDPSSKLPLSVQVDILKPASLILSSPISLLNSAVCVSYVSTRSRSCL